MSIIDTLLDRHNLKWEELTKPERETLMQWTDALQQQSLTLEKVRGFVHSMRDGVEQELAAVGLSDDQDTYLKARLRNLMLLEAFLSGPEKAQAALDRALAGMGGSKAGGATGPFV